jgi:PAS domain S-box-containing protein
MSSKVESQTLEQLHRDIERLSLLPEAWKGLDPTSIAESVLDTLLDMLSLDFVGLRFKDTSHVFLRVAPAFGATCSPEDVRATLEHWSGADTAETKLILGGEQVQAIQCPLGQNASIGVILAGARRATFPDPIERSKLKLAASQTGLACREMRELSDREPPADPRGRPMSDEALAESEWRLHLTINTIPTMAWSTTADGLIDFCNQNFVDYVGWPAEEISGQGFWPIFHPDDTAHLLASWQEIMATKQPRDVEGRIRRADGEYRWFVLRQNPLLDAEGNVIKWYGAGADIEDRKRAETALEKAQAALLASEQNLNLIINSLPVLVWSARPDGSADFINQNWRDYAGEPADKILEWGFLDLYHPDDVPGMMEIWTRDLAHADQTSLKGRIRGADGQYRWFYFAGRKLTDANGVVRWFGCNIDIEDLQRAEDALRASEAALRESERTLSLMLDTIPGMAWSTTAEGYADTFNKNMLDYLGRTLEDMRGLGFLSQFHPDDVDRMLAEWQAMMAAKTGGEIEGRSRRADGEYRWLICRCSPLLNDEGEVLRWYGVNTDIEDRRRAEAALSDSEHNLSLILNSLPVLVWSARPDGSADFVNQRFLDYVGPSEGALLEFGFASFFHPDDVEPMMAAWAKNLEGDASIMQGRIRRHDGTYRWFLFSGQKLTDANGTVRWFGCNVDIEDLHRAEDALRASETALRGNERRLEHIINAVPGLVWSADAEGAVTFLSQQYLDYIGQGPAAALAGGWMNAVHPEDAEGLLGAWSQALAEGRANEHEARLRRADGSYRWMLFRASPSHNEAGQVTEWFGVNIDVEDRKGAREALRTSEAALRESERQLQQIVSSIPGLTWASDAQGATTFWSQQYLDYAGARLEDVLGFGFVSYIHPDDRDRIMAQWAEIILAGAPGEAELRLRRANGEHRWYLIRACPFFDEAGNLTQWFGVNIDIEERRNAQDALRASEAALRESERQLQQIVSSIPGLTWTADARGDVNFWSQGFLDYGGATIEDILGYGFMNYLHPDDHEGVMEVWTRILKSGTQGEAEVRIRRADGQYRWFLWRASPFFDSDGNLTQWFGINVDIENRKRTEENLRQSQNELAHVTRMTTMGELAVSIAHEVNQPLMAIVTNAGTCLRWLNADAPDLPMARQAAERIVRDGHRAGDIITSLRNLARKSAPRLDRVRLEQVIQVVLELMQGELQRHGVLVKTQLDDGAITIRGDNTQLQQVVLNLIMNAIEAMGGMAGPHRLTVRAETRDGDALVTITDTGPGLSAKDPDHLFQAFVSTKAEGIGMGLSICRSIIEAHGGRIWAANNESRGGVFSFTLPLAEGNGADVSKH